MALHREEEKVEPQHLPQTILTYFTIRLNQKKKATELGSMKMSRKAYFNQAAESWDQEYYTPKLETFLEKLVPMFSLRFGQRTLDLGTGTGVLIPFLIKAVGPSGSVTAIDYSERMVQICRAKYSHLKNVRVILQDAEELDLPREYFDVITCFGIFPHLEDKEKALHNMNYVLKLRGKLIIAHALSSDEIQQHHKRTPPVAQDRLPEETVMKRLLKRAGFSKIHITDEPSLYLCLATKNAAFQQTLMKQDISHKNHDVK